MIRPDIFWKPSCRAGVDDPQLRQGMAVELQPEALGQLFRILLAGIMDTLLIPVPKSRARCVDVTTIQPIRNNPVKVFGQCR
ncbi:MAG: type VI secretion system-associated FHA domain protein [Thiolinea sp.]